MQNIGCSTSHNPGEASKDHRPRDQPVSLLSDRWCTASSDAMHSWCSALRSPAMERAPCSRTRLLSTSVVASTLERTLNLRRKERGPKVLG